MWLQQGDYNLESLYWLIGIGVIFVIALAALIVAVVAVVRLSSLANAKANAPASEPQVDEDTKPVVSTLEPRTPEALRLLDGRYANGEITRDQYLRLESDLMSTARRSASAAATERTESERAARANQSHAPRVAAEDPGHSEPPLSRPDSAGTVDWGV